MIVRPEPRPVRGFRFAGVAAGLKTRKECKDLGIIAAARPATVAAVFTTNRIEAAPVTIARQHVHGGRLQAVVANSGSANCFTGRAGMKLAAESCDVAARALGCDPKMVAPCSTGVIGHLYDRNKFRAGVEHAAAALAEDHLEDFARAIMTTDTVPKLASCSLRIGGREVTLAGTAKGAGMISPRMATMLGFIVTDAALPARLLRQALGWATPRSFNAITIDGDMSTNDTLMVLASGTAGNSAMTASDFGKFQHALEGVAYSLARQLILDGEGATRLARIEVRGARSAPEAERVARQIANSPLVKTAFFGCDPNVGRIIAAAGASTTAFEPARIELFIDGVKIAAKGAIIAAALAGAAEAMRRREFAVRLDLKSGRAAAEILTSDLSIDYVKINAEYTT